MTRSHREDLLWMHEISISHIKMLKTTYFNSKFSNLELEKWSLLNCWTFLPEKWEVLFLYDTCIKDRCHEFMLSHKPQWNIFSTSQANTNKQIFFMPVCPINTEDFRKPCKSSFKHVLTKFLLILEKDEIFRSLDKLSDSECEILHMPHVK